MIVWIAIFIGYVAIILAAIEEIGIDKRLKKIEEELAKLKKYKNP